MTLLIVLSCTENEVSAIDKDPVEPLDTELPVLEPGIEVSPEAVDLGMICDEGITGITILSTGEADLEVDGLSFSGSWTADNSTFPWILAPGEQVSTVVRGTGAGEMLVQSNAGDVAVPLNAALDPPPALEILSPGMNEILSMTETTEFVAQAIEAYEVQWTSSIDGDLGTTAVTNNESILVWDPALQTGGTHTITAIAKDACASDSEELMICQQEGYTEGDIDLANWVTTGTAFWDTQQNRVQLTANTTNQAGTAFQTQQSVAADSVDIQFKFYVGDHDGGADGVSVTAIDISRMTTYVGQSGGGIGYMGLPGWSLEFDTWCNGWDATCEDHFSFHIDGDVYAPQLTTVVPNLEDDQWHDARVVMDGQDLTVELDGFLVLEQTVTGNTNFQAYVGFTGATGSATNLQLIDELIVIDYACDE